MDQEEAVVQCDCRLFAAVATLRLTEAGCGHRGIQVLSTINDVCSPDYITIGHCERCVQASRLVQVIQNTEERLQKLGEVNKGAFVAFVFWYDQTCRNTDVCEFMCYVNVRMVFSAQDERKNGDRRRILGVLQEQRNELLRNVHHHPLDYPLWGQADMVVAPQGDIVQLQQEGVSAAVPCFPTRPIGDYGCVGPKPDIHFYHQNAVYVFSKFRKWEELDCSIGMHVVAPKTPERACMVKEVAVKMFVELLPKMKYLLDHGGLCRDVRPVRFGDETYFVMCVACKYGSGLTRGSGHHKKIVTFITTLHRHLTEWLVGSF